MAASRLHILMGRRLHILLYGLQNYMTPRNSLMIYLITTMIMTMVRTKTTMKTRAMINGFLMRLRLGWTQIQIQTWKAQKAQAQIHTQPNPRPIKKMYRWTPPTTPPLTIAAIKLTKIPIGNDLRFSLLHHEIMHSIRLPPLSPQRVSSADYNENTRY